MKEISLKEIMGSSLQCFPFGDFSSQRYVTAPFVCLGDKLDTFLVLFAAVNIGVRQYI